MSSQTSEAHHRTAFAVQWGNSIKLIGEEISLSNRAFPPNSGSTMIPDTSRRARRNPGFHRWVGVGPQFVRPESPRPVRLTGRLGLHYVVPRAESNRAAPARRRREETLHAGPPRGCASPCGPQRRRGSPPSGTPSAGGRQRPRDARGPLASDQSRGRGVPRYAGRLSAERQPRRRSSCPGGL